MTAVARRPVVAAASTLAVGAFVLRLALAAGVPVELDSVQLVLGVDRFDVRYGSPHPPGYYLLILSGRLLHALGLSPMRSLTIVAALASALAVGVITLAGDHIGGPALGVAAGAFLATSPIVLYYGTFPNSYATDLLAASALILVAVRAHPGGREHLWSAAIVGLAAGFRQSALLVYAPIALWTVWRVRRGPRAIVEAAGVGAASVLVWLVPLSIEQPGGLRQVIRSTRQLWTSAGSHTSILEGAGWSRWVDNVLTVWSYTFVCLALLAVALGAALVVTLTLRSLTLYPSLRGRGRGVVVMLALAGVPGLLVTMLHFGKAGYVLSFLPAFTLLLLVPMFRGPAPSRAIALAAVAAVAGLNTVVFVRGDSALPSALLRHVPIVRDRDHGYPFPVTRATERLVARDARSWIPLQTRLDPRRDDLVFVGPEGQQRIRQVMWELPAFTGHLIDHGNETNVVRNELSYALEHDRVIELRRHGRAVFVINAPTADIVALYRRGAARPLRLPTGPTAWIVQPGTTVQRVAIEAP